MRYPKGDPRDLQAPFGKYRVLAVDVVEGSDTTFVLGDFDALDDAKRRACERAGVGTPVYIYDDRGNVVVRYGSWH